MTIRVAKQENLQTPRSSSRPLVSVVIITYNQVNFIDAALESVLQQVVDFHFEICIGDDDSRDGTREICQQYALNYPGTIRLLSNDQNQSESGAPRQMLNFIRTMAACRGKHIAILEGDDFWLGTEKLQKQVDYLAAHPNCAIVFHNAYLQQDSDENQRSYFCDNKLPRQTGTKELLAYNYIPTCSVMYRCNRVHELPESYQYLPMGDWPLHLIHSEYGSIDYLPEVMAVHRLHRGGLWHEARQNAEIAREYELKLYQFINEYFDFRFESDIRQAISGRDFIACKKLLRERQSKAAYRYFSKYISAGKALKPINLYRLAKLVAFDLAFRVLGKRNPA